MNVQCGEESPVKTEILCEGLSCGQEELNQPSHLYVNVKVCACHTSYVFMVLTNPQLKSYMYSILSNSRVRLF